jgi:hypothetical protein
MPIQPAQQKTKLLSTLRGFGWDRWSRVWLYESLGLYKDWSGTTVEELNPKKYKGEIKMKTLKPILVIALLLLVTFNTYSQEKEFPKLTGPYLGQALPGKEFRRFAPNIVPGDMFNSVTVSSDGQEIYWAARNGIMGTKLMDGRWTTPAVVLFSGRSAEPFYDDAPVVSPDNRKLFFTSRRPISYSTGNREHIWYVERTSSGWSEPEPLPQIINSTSGIHFQVSASNSGTLYFGVFAGDKFIIYYSRFINGAYTTPEPFSLLNNFGHVMCPFIAPDESYIIFNKAVRHESEGYYEPDGYYISFKGRDNQWLPPQRLVQLSNRESSFVTRDGKYIFCKELWASAQIIEELRPKE